MTVVTQIRESVEHTCIVPEGGFTRSRFGMKKRLNYIEFRKTCSRVLGSSSISVALGLARMPAEWNPSE